MKEFNTISYFDIDDYERVISQIQDMDYKIYYIEGEEIPTYEEFFMWIKDRLPLDPPMSGRANLDGFVDSLWGGIYFEDYERVALVWKHPDELIKHDKNRFEKLVECINQVADDLLRTQIGEDKIVILKTFFFGKGELFSKVSV